MQFDSLNENDVEILLATYQGENYLEEQLKSLLNQTYPHFRILIRDDKSQDRTREILQQFSKKHPSKIVLLTDDKNLGVKGNFSELLRQSQAKYVLFSDQDDYWLPTKVEDSINQLKAMEKKYGLDSPLLVHTDLQVVDSNLNVIDPSFWHYSKLNPHLTNLNRLLVQNCVTGCTMAMNRALVKLCQPIPPDVIMHDWWIALVASSFGHISHIEKPTMLYRQHLSNTVGAKRPLLSLSLKKFFMKKEYVYPTRNQALCLLHTFEDKLSPSTFKMIKSFCNLKDLAYPLQRFNILKYRFFRHSKLQAFIKIFMRYPY